MLALFLAPAERLYRAGGIIRWGLYAAGALPVFRPAVPVVSVGNIAMGGRGKTPLVALVARHLVARGRRPAILSRGHGAPVKHVRPLLASAGEGPLVTWEMAGDEPTWLAASLRGAAVIVDPRRARAARLATSGLQSDCLILDDGFQHRGIARDLDVVLVAPQDLRRALLRLPAEPLREGPGALRRADLCLLWVAAGDACPDPSFPMVTLAPIALRRVGGKESRPPQEIAGRRVAGFSGLARNDPFRGLLCSLEPRHLAFRGFPDHHPYPARDREELQQWARREGAELVVTTTKDAVKIPWEACGDPPLWALEVEPRGPGADLLLARVDALMA